MQTVELIEPLIETRSGGLDPAHEVTDSAKLARLVASMQAGGWSGAPIVAAGEQALTGTHRLAAAARTWTDVPRIQVGELCAAFGVDWQALLCEHRGDWYEAACHLDEVLPRNVVDYLGLDVH